MNKIKQLGECKIADKIIKELEEKISDLEAQNRDLDYLLNSGRNQFEQERINKLKELEAKLNQPLSNQELLFNLVKKLESREIVFEKHQNEYFLYQKGSNLPVKIGEILIEEKNHNGYEGEKDWNEKFKENYLKSPVRNILKPYD